MSDQTQPDEDLEEFDGIEGEAPPVDEYQLSTGSPVVSGDS
jgi:hypothetical protein